MAGGGSPSSRSLGLAVDRRMWHSSVPATPWRGGRRRRSRAEHTDVWEQIELLCGWPEQRSYELIRPLVHFGRSCDRLDIETPFRDELRRLRCDVLWDQHKPLFTSCLEEAFSETGFPVYGVLGNSA